MEIGNNYVKCKHEIFSAKGKAEKSKALKLAIASSLEFKEAMRLIYDPFIRFNVGPVTEKELIALQDKLNSSQLDGFSMFENDFTDETWRLIEDIGSGNVSGQSILSSVTSHCEDMYSDSRTMLIDIICKNTLSGIGKTVIHEVWPSLIGRFEVMLAHKLDEKKVIYPVAVEPKLDGVRVIALFQDGKVSYHSREGNEFTSLANLDEEMITLFSYLNKKRKGNYFIDGEVVIQGDFTQTVSGVKKKGVTVLNPVFYMFAIGDAAMLSTRGSGMTYKQIREELKLILKDVELSRVTINKSYIANSIDEINAIYLAARDKDLEGVIVKNYNAKYVCKRDKGWMKIKDKQTVDVEVKDVVEGEGKYQGSTGKLVVDYNGVSVGVGSGLSDRLREKFWHRPDEIIGKIIEVSFHEETPDKSLRHPVFECVRIDKTIPNTEY